MLKINKYKATALICAVKTGAEILLKSLLQIKKENEHRNSQNY